MNGERNVPSFLAGSVLLCFAGSQAMDTHTLTFSTLREASNSVTSCVGDIAEA